MKYVDFNCDMGEGVSTEDQIMKHISSCNISCGFHAGNPSQIYHTIELAVKNNVKIGAHPSYFDRENFGRVSLDIESKEMYYHVLFQISTLHQLVDQQGKSLNHVKLHGALYNDSAKDDELALACFKAVQDIDSKLIVYGLPNSSHERAAKSLGLIFTKEAFADRRYDSSGFLVSRSQKGALLSNPEEVADQVVSIVKSQKVKSDSGIFAEIKADTICFHGDHKNVIENLKVTRQRLIAM